MSSSVQKLAKPQLRGFVRADIKKSLGIAAVLSLLAGGAWKYLVAEPRKQRYADFYKTYDAEADYQRMKALGYFKGLPKDDE